MTNPENTTRQVNDAIKSRTTRNITIGWHDEGDDFTSFYICADGDDTNLYVWEDASGFELVEHTGRLYAARDAAKTYEGIAAKIIEAVS